MSSNLTHLMQLRGALGEQDASLVFFRLSNSADANALEKLLFENPQIQLRDTLHVQLKDLIKLENPEKSLTEHEYAEEVLFKLGKVNSDEYGVWIYYPWRGHVIHMLDEEEFVRVRTIRNAYKITFSEQQRLRSKKIGIVGLSVGQSASLAVALERLAGEIRIADFDTLELSNLNRIRSSVSNIGLRKTTMVAREIAELDPYIKVVCFNDGLTRENAAEFFDNGGQLDLLIEECDGIEAKILSREEAIKRHIPVVMSMSDRGMLDIERYDQVHDYPLLHGLVPDSVSYDFLKALNSTQEKLPYMLPIIGTDSLSTRLKASAIEIGETITTWPQLASDVILDGALCAHASRRILLGRQLSSRRQWIDLDQIVFSDDKIETPAWPEEGTLDVKIALENLTHLPYNVKDGPNSEEVIKMVDAAIKAPSPGNNQKWKWIWKNGSLYCFLDKEQFFSFGDNLNWGSIIAIGAAIKNIELEASHLGYSCDLSYAEAVKANDPIAWLTFEKTREQPNNYLHAFIGSRRTYREINPETVALREEHLDSLQRLEKHIDDVVITHITDYNVIQEIGALVSKGDRFRFMNDKGHAEFFNHEVRWNKREAFEKGDGLDMSLFPFSELDKAGLLLSKDAEAIKLLKSLSGGKAFENLSKKSFLASSGLVIFSVPQISGISLIDAGRALQNYWLTVESLGIGMFPMTVLQALFTLIQSNENQLVTESEIEYLKIIQQEFHKITNIDPTKATVFMGRLVYKKKQLPETARLPVEQKLVIV